MGLYQPEDPALETTIKEIKISDKLKPPMKIRHRGPLKAVIDGYTMIPVFSFIPPTDYDLLNNEGCNYV